MNILEISKPEFNGMPLFNTMMASTQGQPAAGCYRLQSRFLRAERGEAPPPRELPEPVGTTTGGRHVPATVFRHPSTTSVLGHSEL